MNLLSEKIIEKYKDINWTILSEENVKIELNYSEIKDHWVWVIDPLVVTKYFVQGTRNYAIHFALKYKKNEYPSSSSYSKNELHISNGEKVWCEKKRWYFKNF